VKLPRRPRRASQEEDVKRKKEARASETPKETAARQEEDAKRKRESREAARLKVNADNAEHFRQRRSADSAARQEALSRTRGRAAHAAALQECLYQLRAGALLGSSVAFDSGCGEALPGVPRKAPLC